MSEVNILFARASKDVIVTSKVEELKGILSLMGEGCLVHSNK